jgi:hypothetical protein
VLNTSGMEICQQNGGISPCTPCDFTPVNPDEYATVLQNTWDVVQTYTPRFWEVGFDDATTTTPAPSANNNGCNIMNTPGGQAAMQMVFSTVTTQMGGGLAVTASGLAYSRVSQTFNGTVTIQNISSSTISGPFYLLFTALTDSVTLANATGTYIGVPYVTVPNAASLAPGQTATAVVRFNNPSFATINFNPLVYTGTLG